MFQKPVSGLDKFDSDYSFVTAYVQSPRLSSLTVAVATIPLAALDVAYHTTAIVLKSIRAVAYTIVLSKTVLKTGPRKHFLPIRNAVIASVAYPIIGTFSSRTVLRIHDYIAPKPDHWEYLRNAAAIVGMVSAAGVLKWLCTAPPKPSSIFTLPVIAAMTVAGGLLGAIGLKKGCNARSAYCQKRARAAEEKRPFEVPRAAAPPKAIPQTTRPRTPPPRPKGPSCLSRMKQSCINKADQGWKRVRIPVAATSVATMWWFGAPVVDVLWTAGGAFFLKKVYFKILPDPDPVQAPPAGDRPAPARMSLCKPKDYIVQKLKESTWQGLVKGTFTAVLIGPSTLRLLGWTVSSLWRLRFPA